MTIADDDPRLSGFSTEAMIGQITDANRCLVDRARALVRDLLTIDDDLPGPWVITLTINECKLEWLILGRARSRSLNIIVQPDKIKYFSSDQPIPGYFEPASSKDICAKAIEDARAARASEPEPSRSRSARNESAAE